MRTHHAALLACLSALAACVPTVTGDDIARDLERALRSVEGRWIGTSYRSSELTLNFDLQNGSGTAVSGSGTMKEAAASAAVPITVTGTFVRPRLTLTFNGMTFEGHAVQGTFAGDYLSVSGIVAPLQLTGMGYSREIEVLLGEG